MQKLFIPALLLTLLAFGCAKSDEESLKPAAWVVSLYEVESVAQIGFDVKTSMFSGYTFEFNNDNQLRIHLPDGNTSEAKWAMDPANSLAAFTMQTPFAPMDEIVGDWLVIEQTATTLKLSKSIPTTTNDEDANLHFQQQ